MLSQLDKTIIRKLQDELPLVPQPYKIIAEELGIKEEELLDRIHRLSNNGILRRLGAVLYHRKAGYKANVMAVWMVPEEKTGDTGKIMASFPQVSHCYKRLTSTEWTYNMFTMIHGRTHEESEAIVSQISKAVRIDDYKLLYSIEETKKTSMKYFVWQDSTSFL